MSFVSQFKIRGFSLGLFAVSIVMGTGNLRASASTGMCEDFFTRIDAGLYPNEFGVMYYNTGTGRNVLSTAHLMGSTRENGVTYVTVSGNSGGLKHFDERMVFQAIEPFRARALVTDPADDLKRVVERVVTVIAARTVPGGEEQFIARAADGKLVRVTQMIHESIAEAPAEEAVP